MTSALLRPEHVGRLLYWFDATMFTPEWFGGTVQRAVADAGPRYTPQLHVDLPIARVFDGLGRTAAFEHLLRERLAALRSAMRYGWRAPEGQVEVLGPLVDSAVAALDGLDRQLTTVIEAARQVGELPGVTEGVSMSLAALSEVRRGLREHCAQESDGRIYYFDDAASLSNGVDKARSAVYDIRGAVEDAVWFDAARRRVLLITGEAGTGKTHLFCDVATVRCRAGMPTVLLLGADFDDRPLLTQIAQQVGFEGTGDQFLATFDTASEVAGGVGLLMIDAINESDDPRTWTRQLAGLIHQVVKHPHLMIAISCRDPYTDMVVPEQVRDQCAIAYHQGFAEDVETAITRFLDVHGIERPSFPVLEAEFANPLFLKLLCSTLQAQGATRFPRGGVSVTWLYEAHLAAVDQRLSAHQRCDYDPVERLARRAVTEIVAMVAADPVANASLQREAVKAVGERLLPGHGWRSSLIKGLLDEGVLLESGTADKQYIRFGYQRLGEVALAEHLAALPVADLAARCSALGTEWMHLGLLSALAVVVPERHGIELVDVSDRPSWLGGVRSTIDSLAWRAPDSITGRTVGLVRSALDHAGHADATWSVLIQLATVPGHPLNADWLHHRLVQTPLPERDANWTRFCNDEESSAVADRLVDWAWSSVSVTADDEVRRLAATTLGWLLTSSRRPLRDRATKALVHLLEGHDDVLRQTVTRFKDVDDPCVTERLFAAACGVAARSIESDVRIAAAESVMESLGSAWPEHVLIRDYARRTIKAGLDAGLRIPEEWTQRIEPPCNSSWPLVARDEDPDDLTEEVDQLYRSLTRSLGRMGDFREKVVTGVVHNFPALAEEWGFDGAVSLITRRVFDRVLELGWTPELLGELDDHRSWSGDRSRPEVERIGKKYQWIALYETIGRITDHHRMRDWGNEHGRYDDPVQLGIRDIDPTATARPTMGESDTPVAWFAPAAPRFDDLDLDSWMRTTTDLPDPRRLIEVTTPDGMDWLTLQGDYSWSEPRMPDEAARRQPYRQLWSQIRSYLVPAADAEAVAEWALGRHWMGRWMPESVEFHGLLLGDHPRHHTWRSAEAERDTRYSGHEAPPATLDVTATWYTGIEGDSSTANRVSGLLPTEALVDALGLRRAGDFQWRSTTSADTVMFDPITIGTGHHFLLGRYDDVRRLLRDNGFTLMWTVLAEKNIMTSDHWLDRDPTPWLELSASYLLRNDGVGVIHSLAQLTTRGPEIVEHLQWPL